MDQNRFTFCPFAIDFDEDIITKIKTEINSVPQDFWHFNDFRNCSMLSIFNPGGQLGRVVLGSKDKFMYTKAIDYCPELSRFIDSQILSWMKPPGRITVLRTAAFQQMNVHIDCNSNQAGTTQYKWRFVIAGAIDSLYFLNSEKQKVHVNAVDRCYILDGGHPHSIELSNSEKLTLCVGSPWRGEQTDMEFRKRLLKNKAFSIPAPPLQMEWVDPILKKEKTL